MAAASDIEHRWQGEEVMQGWLKRVREQIAENKAYKHTTMAAEKREGIKKWKATMAKDWEEGSGKGKGRLLAGIFRVAREFLIGDRVAFFRSYFPQIEMKLKIMVLACKVSPSARAKETNDRISC